MKKRLLREDGVTLVELLATITILSIVIVLAYSVFFNGFDYSKKANETISLQQEANLLITNITNFHESSGTYDIVLDKSPKAANVKLSKKNASGVVTDTVEFSNSNYEYSLYDYSENVDKLLTNTTTVSTAQPLYIKIIINYKNKPSEKYEIKTIISRL